MVNLHLICRQLTPYLPYPCAPFHFIFSNHFFNFSNPNTISLNLNYLYHFKIHKINSIQNGMDGMFTQISHSKPHHVITSKAYPMLYHSLTLSYIPLTWAIMIIFSSTLLRPVTCLSIGEEKANTVRCLYVIMNMHDILSLLSSLL